MYREFNLMNEKGQRYSLTDVKNYCFLASPKGLGMQYNSTYEQLGNTFMSNSKKMVQGTPSGTLYFKKYDNYAELINFIETAESLRLEYKIPFETEVKTYYRDVEINSITKTEKQTTKFLTETITFNCLSLWYEENKAVFTIEEQVDEIRWDFEWDSKFADYDTRGLSFLNKGHTEAVVEIEIDGHVVNPKIQLYVEGELYQEVSFNVEIGEYEKLLYGTKENEFYILKQNTDGTRVSLFNLDVIDFANDNVIRLPKNKSCEIRLTGDNEVLNALVTIYAFYKAV